MRSNWKTRPDISGLFMVVSVLVTSTPPLPPAAHTCKQLSLFGFVAAGCRRWPASESLNKSVFVAQFRKIFCGETPKFWHHNQVRKTKKILKKRAWMSEWMKALCLRPAIFWQCAHTEVAAVPTTNTPPYLHLHNLSRLQLHLHGKPCWFWSDRHGRPAGLQCLERHPRLPLQRESSS